MKAGALMGALLAICTVSSAAGGAVSSGLYGTVTRSPTMPVCSSERPCSAPAKGVTIAFWKNDRPVGRVTTDTKGRYRIQLAAGQYGIRLGRRPVIGRGFTPKQARVPVGRFARVDLSLDTGIR